MTLKFNSVFAVLRYMRTQNFIISNVAVHELTW